MQLRFTNFPFNSIQLMNFMRTLRRFERAYSPPSLKMRVDYSENFGFGCNRKFFVMRVGSKNVMIMLFRFQGLSVYNCKQDDKCS